MLNEILGKGEVNSLLDCFPEAHVFSKLSIYRLPLCQEWVYLCGVGGLGEAADCVATFSLAANTSPKLTFIQWHNL